ncbi:hypothetical protein Pelo_10660 [Pelomyxa schiedti]|nr:hypothetical protein Pelo_10660 [Pelomyxa schiedti]
MHTHTRQETRFLTGGMVVLRTLPNGPTGDLEVDISAFCPALGTGESFFSANLNCVLHGGPTSSTTYVSSCFEFRTAPLGPVTEEARLSIAYSAQFACGGAQHLTIPVTPAGRFFVKKVDQIQSSSGSTIRLSAYTVLVPCL